MTASLPVGTGEPTLFAESPALAVAPEPAAKWTERDLLDRLRVRHNQNSGNGPSWVFMEHVRSHSGFDARSTIDGLAMHLWQSRKHEVHAFEVKVSRSDFRRELADDRAKSAICVSGSTTSGSSPPRTSYR